MKKIGGLGKNLFEQGRTIFLREFEILRWVGFACYCVEKESEGERKERREILVERLYGC